MASQSLRSLCRMVLFGALLVALSWGFASYATVYPSSPALGLSKSRLKARELPGDPLSLTSIYNSHFERSDDVCTNAFGPDSFTQFCAPTTYTHTLCCLNRSALIPFCHAEKGYGFCCAQDGGCYIDIDNRKTGVCDWRGSTSCGPRACCPADTICSEESKDPIARCNLDTRLRPTSLYPSTQTSSSSVSTSSESLTSSTTNPRISSSATSSQSSRVPIQSATSNKAVAKTKQTSGGLSGGAIAGIVVGVIFGIALLLGALYFWRRRRADSSPDPRYAEASGDNEARYPRERKDVVRPPAEMSGTSVAVEAMGATRPQMYTHVERHELP